MTFKDALMDLLASQLDHLTIRQISVLSASAQEPQTVRGLAATLGVNKSVITRTADKLVKLGLVARKKEPQDRRSVLLNATPKGRKLVARWEG